MNCIVLLFVVHCFHGAIRFRRVQDRWFKPHARLRVGSQWYWGVATTAGTHGHINFFETFTAGAQQDKIKYLPQKVYAHKLFPAHQQQFCRFGYLNAPAQNCFKKFMCPRVLPAMRDLTTSATLAPPLFLSLFASGGGYPVQICVSFEFVRVFLYIYRWLI